MQNNEIPQLKQEKAVLFKELMREHAILYARVFTEHAEDLPTHMLREMQMQRDDLYEFLNQKGIKI